MFSSFSHFSSAFFFYLFSKNSNLIKYLLRQCANIVSKLKYTKSGSIILPYNVDCPFPTKIGFWLVSVYPCWKILLVLFHFTQPLKLKIICLSSHFCINRRFINMTPTFKISLGEYLVFTVNSTVCLIWPCFCKKCTASRYPLNNISPIASGLWGNITDCIRIILSKVTSVPALATVILANLGLKDLGQITASPAKGLT